MEKDSIDNRQAAGSETGTNKGNRKECVSLKNRFPFRLGTTSYIVPDEILPNVLFLADKVDDIELVLFESDEISNLPDATTLKMLKETAEQSDLTYTIHLPMDTWMGHEEASVREQSVDKCLRVIERTAELSPFAYVLHFHGDERGVCPSPDLDRWIDGHRRSVERLLQNVYSHDLCVETLDYPYAVIEDIVSDYDLSVCLDIGHLLLCGHTPEDYLDRYLPRTRVLHLHGIEDGHDHRSLSFVSTGLLTTLIDRLGNGSNIPRVLTMEIFDEEALIQSLNVLRRYV
ncbi:MAG: cobamide remodeling phosphodiesterase CbiR [Syntrophaceae bacterium]